jgi:hypothetical protein
VFVAAGILAVDSTWLFSYENQQETYFLLSLCVGEARKESEGKNYFG